MSQTHITSHFLWSEVIVSRSFPEIAAKIELLEKDKYNYYHLISTTLEPERVESGVVTRIEQGKRNDELYQKLIQAGYKPSSTSQHFCRNPFDCAIDFQKIVKVSRSIDIEQSRSATLNAFHWINQNCLYSFGQMYYNKPIKDHEIGFVHLGSRTLNHQSESWVR